MLKSQNIMRRVLYRPPPNSVTVRGILKNFNTIEEFKTVNKQEMFNNTSKEVLTEENGFIARV